MFTNLTIIQKSLVTAIVGVILYCGTTATSYTVFASLFPQKSVPSAISLPKQTANPLANTVSCPLDGKLYSQSDSAEWQKHRPLGVMIENSTDARPQSGLSSADIVYETLAEGGITRFMGVFYCNTVDTEVGPVRSARTYFLDWISEYDGLYAHVGGANTPGLADALSQIVNYKIKDLNQFNIGFPTFWRDYNRLGRTVATEHTMYSSTNKLWQVGTDRGWGYTDSSGTAWNTTFTSWKFSDSLSTPNPSPTTSDITVNFEGVNNNYTAQWHYDASCNCYQRKTGGVNHIDLDTNKQLSPVNIVVQFETENRANDGYTGNEHLLFGTIGKGDALFFMNGQIIKGYWSKASRTARTKYTDSSGNEIVFARGQIWIQTVPIGDEVTY